MSIVADMLAWAALLAGGFFVIVGGVGLHRMPDVFTRMHAASVSDTLGVGFLTLGMLLQTTDWTVSIRLVMILVVLYMTGAVATHALARAALHRGVRPLLAGGDGGLRPTNVAELHPELAERLTRPLSSEQVGGEPPPSSGASRGTGGRELGGARWSS